MMQLKKSKPRPPVNHLESLSPTTQLEFQATGTRWRVILPATTGKTRLEAVKQRLIRTADVFEESYSRFRPTSLVSQLQTKTGSFLFPDTFGKLWQLYQRLSDLSQGAFTPFIGSLLVQAGYDPTYSLETKQLTPLPNWNTVTYAAPYLHTTEPVTLDFGAAGKGYLVDLIGQILHKEQFSDFLIDAGGDIQHYSQTDTPAEIGLEHPLNTDQVIGIATLGNQSLCGSAGNRRQWGTFHHIINPHTQTSPKNILATWVIADTTLEADALATCLFFAPPHTFAAEFAFQYAIVYADQSLRYSSDFPAIFFD